MLIFLSFISISFSKKKTFELFGGRIKKNDTKSNETSVMCIGKTHGSSGPGYSTPPLNPSHPAKGGLRFVPQ